MDNNDLMKQISKKATETIEPAKSSIPSPHTDSVAVAKDDIVFGDESDTSSDSETAQNFNSLPIENLICKPIIEVAKGQQELTSVYIDTLKHLAYSNEVDKKTNEKCSIETPLLSLVPLPAFTMDEITVSFDMEVTTSEAPQNQMNSEVGNHAISKSCFGLNGNITGSVSSDSLHKHQKDSTARYNIHERAVQQPPPEGMAKLTDLFSQTMEPIPKKELQNSQHGRKMHATK